MLDRLRGQVSSALLAMGAGAGRIMPSPTAWTLVGLAFALMAARSFSLGGYANGLAAGLFVIVSGFFDLVDGSVARSLNRISKRGSFLDSTLDRIGEVALYVGVLLGAYAPPLWVLLAVALSLLVSYARAKADSLGVSLAGIGVGERSERLIVLAAAAFLGSVAAGVALVAVLAAATVAERMYRVSAALSEKAKVG